MGVLLPAPRYAPALCLLLALVLAAACRANETPAPISPTPAPTPTRTISCQDLDSPWAEGDWARVLVVLDALKAAQQTCGENTLAPKQYAAHINFGLGLEQQGNAAQAIQEFRAALELNGNGREALDALYRLQALPTLTTAPCAQAKLDAYTPTVAGRKVAHIQDGKIVLDGKPFLVRGVNYYPRHAPWEKFLRESDLDEIEQELDLVAGAGFNSIRIFLDYQALFTCEPERAIPNASAFQKLDKIIALAAARDLKLTVTLNDLPDLYFRPLYTDWARYDAQTQFIVERYRDEPAILMWDLRNEGDLDYEASRNGRFGREQVLNWLSHVAALVRETDSNHLLTAGWLNSAQDTLPAVDVLSFHHWAGAAELDTRVQALAAQTDKPILLQEVGYASKGTASEASQAATLDAVVEFAESNLAGWMVWSAFDFQTDGETESPEYSFGLWRTDLQPKPALQVLPLVTRTP